MRGDPIHGIMGKRILWFPFGGGFLGSHPCERPRWRATACGALQHSRTSTLLKSNKGIAASADNLAGSRESEAVRL
jgi:hypothetical protein